MYIKYYITCIRAVDVVVVVVVVIIVVVAVAVVVVVVVYSPVMARDSLCLLSNKLSPFIGDDTAVDISNRLSRTKFLFSFRLRRSGWGPAIGWPEHPIGGR